MAHQYSLTELKAILKSRGQSFDTGGAKGKRAVPVLADRLVAYLTENAEEKPAKSANMTVLGGGSAVAVGPKPGKASTKRPTPY